MNGSSATEDARLHDLIEILEDGRQFYLSSIPGSQRDTRMHEKKAHCYAAMLAEIRQWQVHSHDFAGTMNSPAPPSPVAAQRVGPGRCEARALDDFDALLLNLNHLYDRLFRVRRCQTLVHADIPRQRVPCQRNVTATTPADPRLNSSHG